MSEQVTQTVQEKLGEVVTDLVNANATGIAEELLRAEAGTLAVSISVKMTAAGPKLHVQGKLGYSRKFTDEAEAVGDLPDPQNPTLYKMGASGEEKAE